MKVLLFTEQYKNLVHLYLNFSLIDEHYIIDSEVQHQ